MTELDKQLTRIGCTRQDDEKDARAPFLLHYLYKPNSTKQHLALSRRSQQLSQLLLAVYSSLSSQLSRLSTVAHPLLAAILSSVFSCVGVALFSDSSSTIAALP